MGYVVVSFGWSVEYGGMDAIVDELFVRSAVRKRGMGSDALNGLSKALKEGGIKALHLEADQGNETLKRFYQRCKFETREGYAYMSREL